MGVLWCEFIVCKEKGKKIKLCQTHKAHTYQQQTTTNNTQQESRITKPQRIHNLGGVGWSTVLARENPPRERASKRVDKKKDIASKKNVPPLLTPPVTLI
jgi:hypothetical protein